MTVYVSRAAPARSSPRHGLPRTVQDRLFWTLCLLPAIAVLVLVFVYPLGYSLVTSFTDSSLLSASRFVGLRNYLVALQDANVLDSIRVTFIFSIISMAIEMVVGFGLALLIHQIPFGRGPIRTLIILPSMLTPVIVGLDFRMMFNYDFGIVNYFLSLLGVSAIPWLINAPWALASVIMVDVWQNTGFTMMVLSAGLATLPTEPFEAALVDGANWWQRLWRITIPLLRPVIVVVLLFRTYGLLRMFDTSYSLTSGGPGRATETLSFNIYARMFSDFQVGYSTAVAYILFGITLIVCLGLIRAVDVEEEV